ncbi:Transposase [Staphylococcus microti]|uniref:Transposase n=1 Tax=Staphylococcus microti TaxID=569857 RepID=A0A380GWT8_9STAP|nr:transposase [Staphylococcus microti]PNZ83391.1 hypothetical protein CD132_02505 [Staphylococcus microti]SUM57947.1 Transposase [Staphylococcus microti]
MWNMRDAKSKNEEDGDKTFGREQPKRCIDCLFFDHFCNDLSICLMLLRVKTNLRNICPNMKELPFRSYSKRRDRYGYQRDFKLYQCEDCVGCLLRSECMRFSTNPNTNKRLYKNLTWDCFKVFTNKQLSDSKTRDIYKKRKIDVESSFRKTEG